MGSGEYPTHLANPEEELREARIEARKFAARSDDELVGLTGLSGAHGMVRDACLMEMQRRNMKAIADFNTQSERQAKTMVRLTGWILALTVVLGVVAALQMYLMYGSVT